MKLTTKMIKQIIREEIEEAKKEEQSLTLDQVAQKLGVPKKQEEQVTQEAFDHLAELSPEQMVMLKDGLMNLIQVAGSAGGLMIMLDKIGQEMSKMKKGKEEEK